MQDSPLALMVSHLSPDGRGAEPTQFDPRFHYLRVYVQGNLLFMASDTPDIDVPGVTGVWYSADRAVLRFRDGRLVASVGTPVEWRHVALPRLPAWSVLVTENAPETWIRTRDVMPGYRYGIRDHLLLKRIAAPEKSNLKVIDPKMLVWFEERLESTDQVAGYDNRLPPAKYALDSHTHAVVYGEQCLSRDVCFTWQKWPVNQWMKP